MKFKLKAALAVVLAAVMALAAFPAFALESAKEVETEQPQQLERGIEPKATSLEAASVQPMLKPVYTPSSYYQNGPYYNNLLNVQLTGNQRTDIVNVAVSQYGYHEGNSISDLGGGNTNGSNNYTEYGYWYGINVNGWSGGWYDSWCAMFVSWCARQAQIPTSILKNSAGAGHSSSYFNIPYYDGANYSPQVGDLFFHKDWTHVGLVKSVNGNTFETIEGNSSNKVTSRTLNRSNYYFGVPNYTSTPIAPPAAPTVGTDSYYYAAGSTVTISWNAVANNDFYWINVYKNGELIIDRSMGNDTILSIPNAQAGGYWVNLSANNSAGGNGSSCEFVVVSSAPEAPIVTTDSTMYAVGSSVTVSWNAVENNQYYWTNVYRNGEMIYDSGLGNDTSFTLANVAPGRYMVLLSANNPMGGNGSSWYFTVVDSAPEAPIVTTDSTMYAVGSTVIVSWNAVENNQYYWTNVYRNGEMIYDSGLGNDTSFTLTNVAPGRYMVLLSANNPMGGNGSSWYFTVVDSAPEAPIVTTDSTMYAVGSSVTVSWNAVENNQYYWTNVYRNGEVIYDSGLGNDTSFTLTNVAPGRYMVLLSANNPMGGNGSSWYFTVVDSAPEAPIVTTDSTMYAVGSTVIVSWNAVENNQYYWTNVYRNGEVIYDSGLGNDTSFTLTDVQPGNYTVLLSANNPIGGNGTRCSFVVNSLTPGDIDGNGSVSMTDALTALRMAMSILPISNLEAADMDGNGTITVADALRVMRIAMGLA